MRLLLSSLTTSISINQPAKYMVENAKSLKNPANHHTHHAEFKPKISTTATVTSQPQTSL
jgi:hypothetical protein